jgi:cyanophycinase-like exopeptidase
MHVMERWEVMGRAHFQRLGVSATPLRIRDRADANRSDYAHRISLARHVWFSGGRANYLAEAFHETLAWKALEHANANGAIVVGSSGGQTHEPLMIGLDAAHVPLP